MKIYQSLTKSLTLRFIQKILQVSQANFFKTNPDKCHWGPRELGDYELILMVRGKCHYEDDIQNLDLGPGDLLLIAPGINHIFRCQLDAMISCIHFATSAKNLSSKTLVLQTNKDQELYFLFKKAAEEFQGLEILSSENLSRMVGEIFIRLLRISRSLSHEKAPLKLKLAKKFIEDNFRKPLTRKEIARIAGVSEQHLNRLFKQYLHVAPLELIEELRIKQARYYLLNSGLSVHKIAASVGYEDPLYFSRVFRRCVGVSPKLFREI